MRIFKVDWTSLKGSCSECDGDFEIVKILPILGSEFAEIQATVVIPLGSEATFSYIVEPKLRRAAQYQPMVNRGEDVGQSLVTFEMLGKCRIPEDGDYARDSAAMRGGHAVKRDYFLPSNTFQMYTEGGLVNVAHPDMSMPFNVITLTCTLLAFVFGTIANVLVKKGGKSVRDKYYPKKEKSTSTLKSRLQQLGRRVRLKLRS